MRSNFRHCFHYFAFFVLIGLMTSCKNQSGSTDETVYKNYVPKGNLGDLAYNPIRTDGTIDSSYLPIIKWDEVFYDFGTINKGDIVEKKFKFKNIGTAPLVILNGTSTCGCTIPEWPQDHILPDSTGIVLVRFDSEKKEGLQNKEVTIFANTIPNQSKINVKVYVEKNN